MFISEISARTWASQLDNNDISDRELANILETAASHANIPKIVQTE